MIITTSSNPNKNVERKAERLAQEFNMDFIKRGKASLSKIVKMYKVNGLLVVAKDRVKYVHFDATTLYFHPNMARIRITSMLKGSKDRLMEISRVQQGYTVLDCTMGLATDAIVFSFAVGKEGKVITIESSTVIHLLVREGLKIYKSDMKEIADAMERIELINIDYLKYLKNQPDKSIDIIYFDPMFRKAAKSVALTPLRKLANHTPINLESIEEVKRVARKIIVL